MFIRFQKLPVFCFVYGIVPKPIADILLKIFRDLNAEYLLVLVYRPTVKLLNALALDKAYDGGRGFAVGPQSKVICCSGR